MHGAIVCLVRPIGGKTKRSLGQRAPTIKRGYCARDTQATYEHALRYATQRIQFGKPIVHFQLVQDLLVRMLGNVAATLCLILSLGQLQSQVS
jgi:hypothetical protein